MSANRGSRIKLAAATVLFVAPLMARTASAEVTLLKNDEWDVYTSGRVNAFLSYGWGDELPLGSGEHNIPTGGGIETTNVGVGAVDPVTMAAAQGTFSTMRIRSGFVPNVLGLGLRNTLSATHKLEAFVSIWGTLETNAQRKTEVTITQMQEGWAKVTGPWGSVLAGRSLDLFSRGATENMFLYGHGYASGFAGNLIGTGPSAGMIGFGVAAAFFSAGLVYATPNLAGLQLTAGVYDPVVLAGGLDATHTPRPEGELTYDLSVGSFKTHLFANGLYQKIYRSGTLEGSQTAAAYGYGGRFEYGPVHLGVAGHRGKGLGLHYALEAGLINYDKDLNLRLQDGYSVMAQYAAGLFDVNVGWGISRVSLTDLDKQPANSNVSILKNESAFYAAFVAHLSPNLHASIDALTGSANWYLGEKQKFNFINTGMTFTW